MTHITEQQKLRLIILLAQKGKSVVHLDRALTPFKQKREGITSYKDLTPSEADVLMQALERQPDKIRNITQEALF